MGNDGTNRLAGYSDGDRGFTVIELMVVVAVIGVIAAIAYPAYTEFLERSRRSEATEALQNLSTLEEQFYNDNKVYSNSLGALGMPTTTAHDYYTLSVALDGINQAYTLSATINAAGAQADDTECGVIQLDSDGNKTPEECW